MRETMPMRTIIRWEKDYREN